MKYSTNITKFSLCFFAMMKAKNNAAYNVPSGVRRDSYGEKTSKQDCKWENGNSTKNKTFI